VVVPTVPTVRLETRRRTSNDADRNELIFNYTANSTTILRLPWEPTSPHWVEIYVDGIRLVNPRTTDFLTGRQYEVFNIVGDVIKFNSPITGELKIICDTSGSHHWRSLIIDARNVQAYYETKNIYNLVVQDWPIDGGQAIGTNYRINYKPGPEFQSNSYVIVNGCLPSKFNGNFKVNSSDKEFVYFDGPATTRANIYRRGTIRGFGNLTINTTEGIGLYSEPIVLTQPYHGYVRLSTDRKSMAYVPDKNYVGNDTFSWSLINQHGQIGEPKCCVIKVNLT
jgi:hypothetical protein